MNKLSEDTGLKFITEETPMDSLKPPTRERIAKLFRGESRSGTQYFYCVDLIPKQVLTPNGHRTRKYLYELDIRIYRRSECLTKENYLQWIANNTKKGARLEYNYKGNPIVKFIDPITRKERSYGVLSSGLYTEGMMVYIPLKRGLRLPLEHLDGLIEALQEAKDKSEELKIELRKRIKIDQRRRSLELRKKREAKRRKNLEKLMEERDVLQEKIKDLEAMEDLLELFDETKIEDDDDLEEDLD